MRLFGLLPVLLFTCCLAQAASPGQVQATMPNGKLANATYLPGEPNKPAILILHGFLQTQDFRTVRRLADALNEEMGYSVLTPTLTLGIGNRRASLACEAIQDHSFGEDVEEVAAWVRWLRKRDHDRIVLIGHSTGSVMIAAYLRHPDPSVIHAILISLTHFGPDQAVFRKAAHESLEEARRLASQKSRALVKFPIAYCREYTATPDNILSYYRWDSDQVIDALKESPISLTVIIGGEDKRMSERWLTRLRQQKQVSLRVVPGASHFFDAEYEFTLLDVIDEIMQGLTQRQ